MRYRSPSSILPWRVVPPASCKVSRVSQYSGYQPDWLLFAYRCFTFCAWPFQTIRLRSFLFLPVLNPTKPKFHGLGSSPFARRYLGNLNWLLFLWVLRCFSSPGLPLSYHHMTDGGLPHSDMHGSQDACSYPCLFAAYRVLHRLLAPRHPPYALIHLTYLRSFAFVFANVIYLNPKMLGSIHFKLIREAFFCFLFWWICFFAFLLLCSFQRSISERNILSKPNNARMCSTHAVTSVTHAP